MDECQWYIEPGSLRDDEVITRQDGADVWRPLDVVSGVNINERGVESCAGSHRVLVLSTDGGSPTPRPSGTL